METYAHAFFTWTLAKHGVGAGRAAGVAGAVGAAMPDAPALAGTAYYLAKTGRFWAEEDLEAIYFTGPFGVTGSALHSVVPAGALLVLYWLLRRRSSRTGLDFDARRVLLWFLLGWAGHTVVDFLTHVDDLRPLLWPFSEWRWSSPVSYYNPRYHGREFMLVSHATMLAVILGLSLRRRRGRKGRGPEEGPRPRKA